MPKKTVTMNGQTVTLDARPDRLDLRDLPYRPPVQSLPAQYPRDADITQYLSGYVKDGLILDQGAQGACTGFGLAATINYLLWVQSGMQKCDRVSPYMLYHLARFYDEWPGENYEGSSCRGALRGWHNHGACKIELWPAAAPAKGSLSPALPDWDRDAITRPLGVYYRIDRQSVVDLQSAIRYSGAIYVSCNVHDGWMLHRTHRTGLPATLAELPKIGPAGEINGVHAFACVGYNDSGLVVQNSWGERWGASGFAILPYEDWVDNGLDAWVVGLGAPVAREVQGKLKGALTSPKHFIHTRNDLAPRAGLPGWLGGNEPKPNRTDLWSEGQAYTFTLVAGNDGLLINRLVEMPSAENAAEHICVELPKRCFDAKPAASRRLVVYAHGGLNGEEESLTRVRAMGPIFSDNDIYPIFITWKSGWAETISDMLADAAQKNLGATAPARGLGKVLNEAWDRTIETIAHGLLARSMWTEMKENVELGEIAGHDVNVLATHLAKLHRDYAGDLEIHLVGHSAGAFVCGRLLSQLQTLKDEEKALATLKVASCSLYAPACDLQFALDHFGRADRKQLLLRQNLHLHVLSDERELDDTVGPYTKSLLYLVSRALERLHKTPLLGLANAHDPARATPEYWNDDLCGQPPAWQSFFQTTWPASAAAPATGAGRQGKLYVYDQPQMFDGQCMIKSAHGAFDNSVEVLERTIRMMLKLGASDPLQRPVDNLHF